MWCSPKGSIWYLWKSLPNEGMIGLLAGRWCWLMLLGLLVGCSPALSALWLPLHGSEMMSPLTPAVPALWLKKQETF